MNDGNTLWRVLEDYFKPGDLLVRAGRRQLRPTLEVGRTLRAGSPSLEWFLLCLASTIQLHVVAMLGTV